MTSSSIVWFSVDRGNVTKALLGTREDVSPEFGKSVDQPCGPATDGDITIGFTDVGAGLRVPAVAVVDQKRAEDLFAWLATYSPDVFPISQYIRLLDIEEWKHTGHIASCTRLDADPIWPSLILGELLAHGNGADLRLTSLQLSRVPFCRSYTQARASALFRSNPDALRIAADRMELLEKAEKQWRFVDTKVLRATWALAEDAFVLDTFTRDLVTALAWTFERPRKTQGPMPQLPEELRSMSLDLRKLATGPLEYRVEEFERVSSLLLVNADAASDTFRLRLPALLAALALWVGSGTSHISLLEEISSKLPATFAWFGAFAGVLGPSCWHSEWARTSAAIAKLSRSGFDVASTSTADLSWTEFAWLLSIGHFELLSGVPRSSAKVVSVDVLPGASAPFRLSADDNQTGINRDAAKVERATAKRPNASTPDTIGPTIQLSKSPASKATLSIEHMNTISTAVVTLSKLLEDMRDSQQTATDAQFELKPTPATTKRAASAGRKTSKKPATRK